MKNKIWAILVAALVVVGIVLGIVLPSVLKKDEGTEANYNIIFANSSIPPTLAAMDSILAGGESYAYIQRGKTYSGIAQTAGFTNSGFDVKVNGDGKDNVLSPAQVQDFANLVKRLKTENKKAKFTIYVTDFDAYAGFAIGIYGGLSDSDFKVVMIEDGYSTYANFRNYFVNGKNVTEGGADEPFEAFKALLDDSVEKINNMKRDAAGALPGQDLMFHSPYAVYALATLSNAEYRVQNKNTLLNDLNSVASSRLNTIYKGEDSEYKINIKSSSISETMGKFNAEQKEKYLTLTLGDFRTEATNMLTRTVDGNENEVSSKKLVYIGSRAYGYDYALVEDLTEANYSTYIVEYSVLQTLAEGGDAFATFLTSEYTESDWASFVALMPSTYNVAYTAAFNKFQEYRYAFSWVLSLYGGTEEGKYDILYKGHPSELVDTKSTFQEKHYKVDGVPFNEEMYTMVNHFHFSDSVGKRIGVLPGGVAVENFAYLGLDFSICGLDSSSYKGYEPSVPVEFVIGGGNYNVFSTNLVGRYIAGNLLDSAEEQTLILNKGNLLKLLGRETEYKNWVKATFGITENVDNYTLDRRGLLAYSDKYVAANSLENNVIKRNVVFGHMESESFVADKTVENVANGTQLSAIVSEFAGTVPEGKVFAGWAYEGQTTVWNSYFNTVEGEIRMVPVFTNVTTEA